MSEFRTRHLRPPEGEPRSLGRRPESRPHERDVEPRVPRRPMLGLVVNLRYPENLEVVAEARRRGAESDCTILIADANEFVGREDAYRRLLCEGRVDGLLLGTLLPTTEAVAAIARQRRPLVLVNRRIPWLAPGVAGDDEAGLHVAVEHLVRLGHHRIAYIGGPGEADTVHLRLDGFRHAMARAGLPLRTDYVTASSSDPDAGSARAVARLLAQNPRPTAIVLWTVGDAPGALHALRAHGLSVPRDVSLVAINDAPHAAYLDPPLTVVRLPLAEVAGRAVGRLFDAVHGRAVTGDILIRTPPILVARGSSASPGT